MIPNNHNNPIVQNQNMNNFHNGPAISSIPTGSSVVGQYSTSGLPPQRNLTHLLSQSLPSFPANKQHIPVSTPVSMSNIQNQRSSMAVSQGQSVSMDSNRLMTSGPSRIIPSQHMQQPMSNMPQGMMDQSHTMIIADGMSANMSNVAVSSAGGSLMSSSQFDPMLQHNIVNQQRAPYVQQQRSMQQPHQQLVTGNSQHLSSQNLIPQNQMTPSQPSSSGMINMQPQPIQQQQSTQLSQFPQQSQQQFNDQTQPVQQLHQSSSQQNISSERITDSRNTTINSGPSEASNVDKRKLIQQQLRLLLHAYVCKRSEQESTNCPPHCRTMRTVISHMASCQLGKNCQTPHCASSRQIISHYKTCTNGVCPVCQPLKSNLTSARPGTSSMGQQQPLQQTPIKQQAVQPQGQSSLQHSQSDPSQPSQQLSRQSNIDYSNTIVNGNQGSGQQINSHNLPPNQQAQPSYPNNLQASNPHLNSMLQDTPLPINGISHNETNGTDQGWRSQVKGGHRQHLVRRIVQTIFPSRDPTAYKDPRMSSLIDYAKKVEKDMFQVARGIDEYFQMLAEKCHKIHKELSEKRRSRQAPAAIEMGGQCPVSTNAGHPNNIVTSPMVRNSNIGPLSSTASVTGMDMAVSVTNSQSRIEFSAQSSTQEADSANIRKFDLALRSEYNRHQQSIEETVPTNECSHISSHMTTSSTTIVKSEQNISYQSTTPDSALSTIVSTASTTAVSTASTIETSSKEMKLEPRSFSPAAVKSASSVDAGSTDNTPKTTPNNFLSVKEEMKDEPATPGSCSSVQTPAGTPQSSDKLIKSEAQTKNMKRWTREELLRYFLPLHKKLKEEKEAGVFHYPVNPDELHIPDYYKVITNPMDLSTINKKLEDGEYSDPWAVVDDYWLMFNNAWLYNKKTSKVYKMCSKLAEFFDSQVDSVMQGLGYCCGHDLFYLPQLLYCSSPQICIIGKEAVYFQYDNINKETSGLVCEKYLLCDKCFNDPGDEAPVTDDPSQPPVKLKKDQFFKKKNNVKEREAFVLCRECGRKWHQVCALHLPEIWTDGFVCKTCVKEMSLKRKENRFTAKKLPSCKLSAYLEKRVNDFLKKKDVSTGEVTIRVLSSCDKTVEVKPGMRSRFSETGEMAESFPYRLKAIFAYQDIDGQDVCFFGLHVQEYGSECPQPNHRRVYVSYLDSVFFFRPKEYRTDVYHEILVGYLHYVKYLGYTMAHIWACPPGEGDDYIFHMHPAEQRIPKPKRLQEWYQKMLEKALSEGTVVDYRDILRDACETKMVSPAEIPYFEGDFWPNTFEEIFRELDAEVEKRKQEEVALMEDDEDVCDTEVVVNDKRAPDKKKPKKRKGNGRSGISTKRKKCNNPLEGGDDLSRKVYETMDKNKDMFFVIRLHKQSEASNLQKIEDPDALINCDLMDGRDNFLQLARDKHLEFSSLRRAKFSSMLMVYELHTENRRDFMYTCNVCNKNIDTRYHCNKCEEYDLCPKCYLTEKHPHPMQKIALGLYDDESSPDNNEATIQESRRSSLERFVKVLGHSSQCRDVNCRFQHCCKMKQWTNHFKLCKKKATKQCPLCQRFLCLLFYHAKCCQDSKCVVPLCRSVKENMRQQQIRQRLQQTQMLRRRMATMQERGSIPQPNTPTPNSMAMIPSNGSVPQQKPPIQQQNLPMNPVQQGMGGAPGNNMQRPCYPSQGAIEAANQAQQMAQMQRFSPAQHQQVPPHSNPGSQQQHPMAGQQMIRQQQSQQQQPGSDPQAWRMAQAPPISDQRAMLTIAQQTIASIRNETPDPAEAQKKIREWFNNHKPYYEVYRRVQQQAHAQQQQQQQQQHQMRHMAGPQGGSLPPQQQAPPLPQASQQQPQLRGMLMNGQQQPPQQGQQQQAPGQPQQHHQWMMQQPQAQQKFRGSLQQQQSVSSGGAIPPPAYPSAGQQQHRQQQQGMMGGMPPRQQSLPSAGMTFSRPSLQQQPGGLIQQQQSQMYSVPTNQDPSSVLDPSTRTDLMPPHFVDNLPSH